MISTREVFAFLVESAQSLGFASFIEPKLWQAITAVASSDAIADLVGERSYLVDEFAKNPPPELSAQLRFRQLEFNDLVSFLPRLQAIKVDFNVRFLF